MTIYDDWLKSQTDAGYCDKLHCKMLKSSCEENQTKRESYGRSRTNPQYFKQDSPCRKCGGEAFRLEGK